MRIVARPARDSLVDDVLFVEGERILLQHYLTVVTGVAQSIGRL
jgi:hypothetical protein